MLSRNLKPAALGLAALSVLRAGVQRAFGPLRFLGNSLLVVFIVSLLYSISVVAAEEECVGYRIYDTPHTTYYTGDTKQEACDAMAAHVVTASHISGNVSARTLISAGLTGAGGNTCKIDYSYVNNNNGSYNEGSSSWAITEYLVECPFNPCEDLVGTPAFLGYTGEGTPSAPFCSTDDGSGGSGNLCKVKKSGAAISTGTGWYGQVEIIGEMCTGEEPVGDYPPPNCVSDSGGQICIDKTQKYCGTINGEPVCVSDVPDNSCALLAQGGALCVADSPAVPKDEEGEPLPPDRVIEVDDGAGTTTEYNYYRSATIEGSSTPVVGTENGTGSGSGSGEGGSEGVGGSCSGDDCYGELPAEIVDCAEDLAGCVAGHVAQAWDDISEGVPLLGFVTGLHASFAGGGSCPGATVDLLETEVDLTGSMCELLDGQASLISLIMCIMWSLAALRVLLTSEN